jgi:hypothetical protein
VWRVAIRIDPHNLGKLDPDPHQSGKLNLDLDPHQVKNRIRTRIKEDHFGALEGLKLEKVSGRIRILIKAKSMILTWIRIRIKSDADPHHRVPQLPKILYFHNIKKSTLCVIDLPRNIVANFSGPWLSR